MPASELGTLAGLSSALLDWMDRDDLSPRVPDFIKLLEADVSRRLKSKNVARTSKTAVSGTETIDVADLAVLEFKSISLNLTSTARQPVQVVTPDRFDTRRMAYSTTGASKYAMLVNDVLYLAPVPDAAYVIDMTYYMGVPALTDGAPTNWLLTQYPDVYLYGALVHAAPFLKNDERLVTWKTLFNEALEGANLAAQRKDTSPTLSRPISRPIG